MASYNMFSFSDRNKIISKFYAKPKPKATILTTTTSQHNIVYPNLLKNKYIDNNGLVKDKILLAQYSKTLNNNHYSNFFTNK